jgi:DNA-binding CsgD family transcriptional regulator
VSDGDGTLPGVTRREAEVLAALGQRLTNREIATQLYVSERTVESHVSALLRKLHAGNRLELAARASARALQELGPSDVAVPLPSIIEGLAARPLVGPAAATAEAALTAPSPRRVVWVRGPAGIGKTRLLAEIAHNAHTSGAVVLYGHFDEELGAPYQGVRDALRYWVTNVSASTVHAAAGVWLPQLAALVPEAVAEPAGDRRRDGDRYTLFEAVDALLSRVSVASPVVLLLDDLHWAGTASLLLLRHLARSTREGRLTIVGAYRNSDVGNTHPLIDVLADLHRDGVATSIDVAPLDPEALTQLVDDLGVVPSGAVPVVIAKSGGNPFFALELARHIADTDEPAAPVPTGVRVVVRQRLSRLSSTANEALQVAAIVGPEFGESVVEAAGAPGGRDLRNALDEATRTHLLEEVPGTIGRYRFTHDLVRQAIAEELTHNARVRVHWAAGTALATFEPDERAAIAYHLSEGVLAGDVTTAADALLAAAAEARETAAWERAAEMSARCVALLDDMNSDDVHRRYDALIGAYRGYRALGAYREARAACDGAIAVARRSGRSDHLTEAVLGRTVWRVYRRTADEPDYLDLIDAALAALAAGDSVDRAMLLARRARVIEMHADSESDIAAAVELAETGLAMAQRLGDPAALLEAHDAFAQVVAGKLAPIRYLELARGAIQVAEATPPEMLGEDIVLLGRVTNRLAAAGRLMADPDTFAEGCRRTERLAEVTGIPHTRAMVLRLRAGEALAQGRLDEAVDLVDAMVATCGHDLNFLTTAWEVKMMSALVAGNLDDAVARLRRSVTDTRIDTREMDATLALALAATGSHDEASTSIAALIDEGLPWTWARPRALWAAAETAARLDDRALATTLRPLLDVHSRSFLSPYAASCTIDGAADTSIGILDAVLGHFDHAMARFSAGLVLEERMGYDALAARTRTWWAWALTRRGRADDLEAATALRTAADAAARRLGLGLVERDLVENRPGGTR